MEYVARIRRLGHSLAPAADPALAAVVLVVSLLPLFREEKGPIPTWGYVVVVAQCLPLVFRRRWPLAVAIVCGGLTVVYGMSSLPDPPVPYAGLLALYSVAAHGSRDHANAAGITGAFAVVGALVFDPDADLEDATVMLLLFATAWLLGDGARRRRDAAGVAAAAAVAAERNRIARELHDVVAHHLSMMVVQAEAGAVAATHQPDRTVPAFDAIGAAGKQALREMRRLLGVLKTDDAAARAPQPGAGEITDLVAGVRAAGVDVRLKVTGEARELPPAVGLSAYRVVQEALTNCVRHARASTVEVGLDYGADALRIGVTDDGIGAGSDPADGGHGVAQMRERVALVGGTLDAGPAPDRGWTVRAELPLEDRG